MSVELANKRELKPKKSVALSGVEAGTTALCTVGHSGNDLHYRGYDILRPWTWHSPTFSPRRAAALTAPVRTPPKPAAQSKEMFATGASPRSACRTTEGSSKRLLAPANPGDGAAPSGLHHEDHRQSPRARRAPTI